VIVLRKIKTALALVMVCILIFAVSTPGAGLSTADELKPVLNQGHKWRIGYCESEPFVNYASTLHALIQGFAEYGWLKDISALPYIKDQTDTKAMWQWLASNDVSDYLEFPADAHYTLNDMQAAAGRQPQELIIDRLNGANGFDAMIVMGTAAGTLLANDSHQTKLFVFSASNAYKSGIVQNIERSGSNHIWAHMDANRFQRQLQVFYDIFHFKKMGIVYQDTEIGRRFASLEDIESMAQDKGFALEREFVNEPLNQADITRYRADLKSAYQRLAEKVDAFYLTVASIDPAWLEELLQPFYTKGIPVFSQLGSGEVQYGALMSISYFDFPNLGRFGVDTIIQALKGKPVAELDQTYVSTPQIILNLEVAKKTGFKPTFDILLVADTIYNTIG
jgi:ABC-type uncharacterized transport system substrate-binding protein